MPLVSNSRDNYDISTLLGKHYGFNAFQLFDIDDFSVPIIVRKYHHYWLLEKKPETTNDPRNLELNLLDKICICNTPVRLLQQECIVFYVNFGDRDFFQLLLRFLRVFVPLLLLFIYLLGLWMRIRKELMLESNPMNGWLLHSTLVRRSIVQRPRIGPCKYTRGSLQSGYLFRSRCYRDG